MLNETAEKCDFAGQVEAVTAIAAQGEVAAGINVLVTTKLTAKKQGVAETYHVRQTCR